MYNGVGVPTARGTGTNAYVQRNLAHVDNARQPKPYTEYNAEEDIKKLEAMINREPNRELLMHERKRQVREYFFVIYLRFFLAKVELKCIELEDLMESQGYTQAEIDKKVDEYRKLLLKEMEREKLRGDTPNAIETDEYGRQVRGMSRVDF